MLKPMLLWPSLAAAVLIGLAACSSSPYYQNDGPPGLFQKKFFSFGGDTVKLKVEQPNKWANRPYTVMGKRYYPVTGDKPLTQTGTASWYGKQFHGKKTAIGEIYDMHAMTAAHPTMELPSYAKVTNLKNGRSVIVRVNDRGPFLHGRVIDLSYAAAVKLGYQKQGTTRVRVERITRRDIAAGRIPAVTGNDVQLAAAPARPAPASKTLTASRTTQASSPPSFVPSAQPAVATASNPPLEDDAMRGVVGESEYADRASVTLSIPVESAQQATQEDSMRTLLERTTPSDEPEAASPAEVLPSAIAASAAGTWTVQIGAYGVKENARQAAAHAEVMLASVQNAKVRVQDNGTVFKVLTGSFESKDEAATFARTVTQALGTTAFAVTQ